jgi:hypothetical protein
MALDASTFEHATAVQRALHEERRAAARSPVVPFVPMPPPPGWLDLASDIEEMFAGYSQGDGEVFDALVRGRAETLAVAAKQTRDRRRWRLANGQCAWCGEPLAKGSRWFCAFHQEYVREHARLRVQARVDAGLCASCGEARADGDTWKCASCRVKDRERRERRLDAGLCYDCEEPRADGDAWYCALHRARYRERRRKNAAKHCEERRAAGLCACCDDRRAEGDGWFCALHRARHRKRTATYAAKRRADNRAAGLCEDCKDLRAEGDERYCTAHRAKRRERNLRKPSPGHEAAPTKVARAPLRAPGGAR